VAPEIGVIQQAGFCVVEEPSTAVKVHYLASQYECETWSYKEMRRVYDQMSFDPPFNSQVEVWFRAEPEFSRRLTAHMTVNHLRYVDPPRRERPPLLDDDLFDAPLSEAAPDGALSASDLLPLLKSSRLIKAGERSLLARYLDMIDRTTIRSACLQVALASHAYYREHGAFPERLSELHPEYLAELPDDPYSPESAPVVYFRTGDEAVVYSRYTNGEDDGGMVVTYREARGEPPDFGLRVRAPRR
jgi:hypothetical protein